MRWPRRGFTLIEMLVVISILVVVFGIALSIGRREQRSVAVEAAAGELAATLREARSLAISRQAMYGVAFNIRNAEGTSGVVLNNHDGGHWYRVIGPAARPEETGRQYNYAPGAIPIPGAQVFTKLEGSSTGVPEAQRLPLFRQAVADAWVGEPQVLPPRAVRFLALSDTDEGPIERRPAGGTGRVWYGSAGYPRPYFGSYDAANGILRPWGGYDPAVAGSGFRYQGSGPAISDSLDAAGVNRPLVDAHQLESCIIFLPSGEARYLEFNRVRRFYPALTDRAKMPYAAADQSNSPSDTFTGPGHELAWDIPEVAHFTQHTGGWHITLAADAQVDSDRYPDAHSALEAVGPMYRVFVSERGGVDFFRVQQRKTPPPGTPWPADPSDWQSAAAPSANPIHRNCRLGWLHQSTSGDVPLVRRGQPITNVVAPVMLERQQWWLE